MKKILISKTKTKKFDEDLVRSHLNKLKDSWYKPGTVHTPGQMHGNTFAVVDKKIRFYDMCNRFDLEKFYPNLYHKSNSYDSEFFVGIQELNSSLDLKIPLNLTAELVFVNQVSHYYQSSYMIGLSKFALIDHNVDRFVDCLRNYHEREMINLSVKNKNYYLEIDTDKDEDLEMVEKSLRSYKFKK